MAVTSGFFDGSLEAVPTVSCVVNNAFCSQAVLGYPFQTSSRFDAHTYPSNIPSGIKSFFNVPADTAGMFTTSRGERLTIIGPAPAAVTAVPEPASWAMLIAGFAIAGIALRRRKVAVRFG